MTINMSKEADPKTRTMVRENADRYVKLPRADGRENIRYSRTEQQFWLNAEAYNIRCALLSDASVEWRRLHIANAFHDLARAEGQDTLLAKASLPLISTDDRLDIQVSAPATIQEQKELGFISEAGPRPFIGQLLIEICIGPRECSSIRHLNSSSVAPDETTYVSLFISEAEMKWLRDELHRCPNAVLAVFVKARVFQEESDARGSEAEYRQRFFIEQGGVSRITQATLQILAPESSKEAASRDQAQSAPFNLTVLEASQELVQEESPQVTPSPFSDDVWQADGSVEPKAAPKKRPSIAIYAIIALQLLIILALFFKK